ncbi:MAG: hypothetical protein ACOC3Z_01350, partial [Nanoarchaeota archaeon]
MTLIGALNNYGFDADLYYNIDDFSKKIALVPCSAKTNQGIPELIMMLCGLSQKYLTNRLELEKDAKGVALEVKKEKSGNYIEAILYDGELSKKDTIAISNFNGEPIITKIRVLEEIKSLCEKFESCEKVTASTGFRMQIIEKQEVLSGMPFVVYKNNKEEIKSKFKKEIQENIKTDKQGIIAKADSLGSLEALLVLLRQSNIPVVKVGIGNINKTDIISAKANKEINELDAVIIGFNTGIDEEAKEIKGDTKIIRDEVVYKLIEDLIEFRKQKQSEIEKKRLTKLNSIFKLKILSQHVFRNTNPAIFGVEILNGKLKSGLNVIDNNNEKIGKIKKIQSENKSVEEAEKGKQVAISIPNINFERRLKDIEFIYPDISEKQFREFKKNKDLLTGDEISTLNEIKDIKRKTKENWGE